MTDELNKILDAMKRDRLDGDKFYIHHSRMQYLLSQEQQRRAVQPEEVQRAIETMENIVIEAEEAVAYFAVNDLNIENAMKNLADYSLAISALRQMQGWIPVINNTYPHDTDVLCIQEFGARFVAQCESDSGHWYKDFDKMADPTHWMNLPEPPKEET